MSERFLRSEMLLGPAALDRLARSHVCVVGLGGVGSWAAEVLARSGVGELTLIDQDVYGESNINRQLGALTSTLGRPKAEVMADRVRDINPDCAVRPLVGTYSRGEGERFFGPYDCIVDAIDLVSCKLDLIETAHARGIPIISALGTGNKRDAQLLRIADIAQTEGCPLARVVRKELRKRGIARHKVVFSPELACNAEEGDEAPPPGRRSVPASAMWVPAAAGLLLVFALLSQPDRSLLAGFWQIQISETGLITDPMSTGGVGAALLNAALILFLSTALIRKMGLPFTGAAFACLFLMAGFSLLGKNLLNIAPIVAGGVPLFGV